MEITSQQVGDFMELRANGRLDGYWADHLSRALEDHMRSGSDRIRVNLSEVTYISSMGIRVLVLFYRKLQAIEGAFEVSEPSKPVKKVLEMVGLIERLSPKTPAAARPAEDVDATRRLERDNATFDVFALATAPAPLKCRTVGDPTLLAGCRFGEAHCRSLLFPESSMALGLGALGGGFEECRERFGEFLAVAGAAAYQPTDGSNVPDYLLAEGASVPELQVLYGAVCEGPLSWLVRFEVKPESRAVGLTELSDACLELAGTDQAAVVIVAESAGLAGATLKKPPLGGTGGGVPFEHPEIREWLSFTTERAYARSLALAVGVVSRSGDGPLRDLVRPLRPNQPIQGHFHAAAFTYRPLQRGRIELRKTVKSLFEDETLEGLLHLIGDDRQTSGVAESEFVRGACWVGPIHEIVTEGETA
jgi:anti-anti-sigma factor